jgi:hypothetical protein
VRLRILAAATVLGAGAAACGGGLSLGEYAATVESAVAEMNEQVDAAQTAFDAAAPVPASARELMERRAAARRGFLEVLNGLEPPAEAEELHHLAARIVDRLAGAEEAVAQLAARTPSDELASILESPQFASLEAVDAEAVAVCDAAQAVFDDTAEREAFDEVLWMPRGLKEVVDVAFRCRYEDRIGER